MDTVQIVVRVPDEQAEIIIADLADFDFYAFETGDRSVTGYITADDWTPDTRKAVMKLLESRLEDVDVREATLENRNWNAIWEAGIEPVEAGGFLILPSWHERSEAGRENRVIRIDPKMSFGTGHHETTRLMLTMMSKLNFAHKTVLDAGTGTGVLAVAASLQGAANVIGFDNDPWALPNAEENLERNNITNVQIIDGSVDKVRGMTFDVILANIIQNVIESFLPSFCRMLTKDGFLLVSGILGTDSSRVIDRASNEGFVPVEQNNENAWTAILFTKENSS